MTLVQLSRAFGDAPTKLPAQVRDLSADDARAVLEREHGWADTALVENDVMPAHAAWLDARGHPPPAVADRKAG